MEGLSVFSENFIFVRNHYLHSIVLGEDECVLTQPKEVSEFASLMNELQNLLRLAVALREG